MQEMNVPGWVVQAFVRSALDAGATAERALVEETAYKLLEMWAAPERIFHNTRHLTDMLARVDTLATETQSPCLVRLATWGHGLVFNISDEAVYSRNGGEDERASAALAVELFEKIGIPEENLDRISSLISSLHKRHDVPGTAQRADETARFDSIDVDRLALYDAHFGSLATAPQHYKTYVSQVREEYTHVPDQAWLLARRRIVEHLLARKRIFLTPLAADWEPVARQNLSAELERIEAACTAALEECRAVETAESADNTTQETVTSTKPDTPATETVTAAPDTPVSSDTDDPMVRLFQTAQMERISETVEPEESAGSPGDSIDDEISDVIQPHIPVVKRSSLEELDEAFTPGAPPRVLDHSQAEAARREQIAKDTIETIERKHQEAREEREGQAGLGTSFL